VHSRLRRQIPAAPVVAGAPPAAAGHSRPCCPGEATTLPLIDAHFPNRMRSNKWNMPGKKFSLEAAPGRTGWAERQAAPVNAPA